MTAPRTAARAAAALGAATALTVAGAGAAMATTTETVTEGNTVSVTFTLDGGFIDGDACGALLAPTSTAATLAGQLANATSGNLLTTLQAISEAPGVELLKAGGSPAVVLGTFGELGVDSATASATVDSNVYALVTYCASDDAPAINPFLLVGDPIEAIMGSVASGSEGDLLGTASSLLSGEKGEGDLLGTASSLLSGEEGEGDLLTGIIGGISSETETE